MLRWCGSTGMKDTEIDGLASCQLVMLVSLLVSRVTAETLSHYARKKTLVQIDSYSLSSPPAQKKERKRSVVCYQLVTALTRVSGP